MNVIISGSNRKGNLTLPFATYVFEQIQRNTKTKAIFLDFSNFQSFEITNLMYGKETQPNYIKKLQDEIIIPSKKIWFFIPEYNGSYPGFVKMVIDSISVRAYHENFSSKKAFITGVASGRAGNLRGMDHLSDVLNHLGMYVYPNKLPISCINNHLDEEKRVANEDVKKELKMQIEQFLSF